MFRKGFWEIQKGKKRFYPICDYPLTKKQIIKANGIQFGVETEGKTKGTPLIILHGGPGYDHRSFHPKMSILAKNRRLIYYDSRGCYMSSQPKNKDAYGILYDVKDLEGLRNALGLKQIDILGYSYGGLPALIYALIYPEGVRHIIICSTPIGETDEEINKRVTNHPLSKAYKKAKSREEKDELYYKFSYRKPVEPEVKRYNELARIAYVTTNKSGRLQKAFEKEDREMGKILSLLDWRKCIQHIKKPVLFINGKYDPIVSVKVTRRLIAGVNNAKFVLFKESSHDPFVDEPTEFNKIINRFLSLT